MISCVSYTFLKSVTTAMISCVSYTFLKSVTLMTIYIVQMFNDSNHVTNIS